MSLKREMRTIATVWGCGDDVCGCSQAQILVEGPNETGIAYRRIVLEEGPFHTGWDGDAEAELKGLAEKWNIQLLPHSPFGSREPTPDELAKWEAARK